jgi:hypothetical protein
MTEIAVTATSNEVLAERRPRASVRAGYTGEAWREAALARAADLANLAAWARAQTTEPDASADILAAGVRDRLAIATEAAEHRGRRWRPDPRPMEALQERTLASLDAAECDILRLAPLSWLRGQLPALLGRIRACVPPDDPTREAFERLVVEARDRDLQPFERDTVVTAVQTAGVQRRHEVEQIRYLRHILVVVLGLLTVAALTFAVIGFARPDTLPLCFPTEGGAACPTSQSSVGALPGTGAADTVALATLDRLAREAASPLDILLVEVLGVIAASLSAATALQGFRSRRSPYDFPLLLALLKLPTGALTAVLGLLLIRAQFVPGLTALDSATQIVAWAVVLGYAQRFVTGLVDKRAQTLLDAVDADPVARTPADDGRTAGAARPG